MGVWVHRLTELDRENRTAICASCGPVRTKPVTNGKGGYIHRCYPNNRRMERRRSKPYLKHRTNECSRCGFTHDDVRVFDVHHLDGDHQNNNPNNLATVCPTCHRIAHLPTDKM